MTLINMFSESFFGAFLWMLVHSLWQALLAAALAGAVVLCTRKKPAALRYNLLVGICGLFLLAAACTFAWCYQSAVITDAQAYTAASSAPLAIVALPTGISQAGVLQPVIAWIDLHADGLMACWLIMAICRGLWLSWHYRQAMTLRRQQLQPVDRYWQKKLISLSATLGVRRAVGFFESGLAKMPLVVGYFKPMLLVPVGFFNGLPATEVEAVLVHELAHIRRADYLVNLMQHLMELVFFFNLPLLWISAQIRREREHCCDDIAVTYTGNKHAYIHALVAFGGQELSTACAAALGGKKKMPLLERVKRLIYNHNQTLTTMERISLLTGVLAVALFGFAFTNKQAAPVQSETPALNEKYQTPKPAAVVPVAKPVQVVVINPHEAHLVQAQPAQVQTPNRVDTSGDGQHEIHTTIKGKRYQMTFVKDKLTAMSVDGVAVPQSRFGEYNDIVKIVLEQKAKAEEHAKVAEQHARKAEEHARRADELAKNAAVQAAKAEVMAREAESRAKDAEQHERDAAIHIREAEEHAANAKEHAAMAEVHAKEAKVHSKVYEELVKDGLVKKQQNGFTLSMDNGKMIINGVEQPKEVYEKYKRLMEAERKRQGLQ